MCLGALSKGAHEAILPHLKDLFPFLLKSLSDSHPLVRSISCWALSKYRLCLLNVLTENRFTNWILLQGKSNPDITKGYLTEILQRMMEDNPQVQEAACTALSKMLNSNEESVQQLEQYIDDIIQVFEFVSSRYQKKSLAYLYDTIASLIYNVDKSRIQDPKVEEALMRILVKDWSQSEFNNLESIYLVGNFVFIQAMSNIIRMHRCSSRSS